MLGVLRTNYRVNHTLVSQEQGLEYLQQDAELSPGGPHDALYTSRSQGSRRSIDNRSLGGIARFSPG